MGDRLTISGEERNGSALGASTTGPPNTMNIVLGVIGVIVVQNMSDVTNIFIIKVSTRKMISSNDAIWQSWEADMHCLSLSVCDNVGPCHIRANGNELITVLGGLGNATRRVQTSLVKESLFRLATRKVRAENGIKSIA